MDPNISSKILNFGSKMKKYFKSKSRKNSKSTQRRFELSKVEIERKERNIDFCLNSFLALFSQFNNMLWCLPP